jgi:hypothetical protein
MLVSLIAVPTLFAQNFEVALRATDGANADTMYFGIVPGAQRCIIADCFGSHCEVEQPPVPPAGVFDTRFLTPAGCVVSQGSLNDYRPFTSPSQVDTFKVYEQLGAGTTMTFSWPSNLATLWTSATLRYFDGSGNVNVNMLTTTSADVTPAVGGSVTIFTGGPLTPPDPGPCFSMSVGSINFGNVGVGGNVTVPVTVTNNGFTNTLNVSAVVAAPTPPFTVAPAGPVAIPHNGTQIFQVTFAPPASGPFSGNVTFTHDGLGTCGNASPTVLPLSGVGTSQGGDLLFSAPSVTRCDASDGYLEKLQLVGYVGDPLKAIQLKVHVPNTLLINVSGVQRGANLPASGWNFSYVINHLAGEDVINIVAFGNGSTALPPGTYTDLIRFNYGTVDISTLTGSSSISFSDVLGSTPLGVDAHISAGPAQTVNIVNQVYHGDVNNDGVLDILDMLLIVDHILGNITLTGDQFLRADINTDGSVNVQDLALLQNYILTGTLPPSPCVAPVAPVGPVIVARGNGLAKMNSGMDVKLTFHITAMGIAVQMESAVKVKGMQLEFGSVSSVLNNVNVSTLLGEGYYYQSNDKVRVLMYNQHANVLEPGQYIVGDIPFALMRPGSVTVDNVVVAGIDNRKIQNVEIEITQSAAPELPVDFMLYQNYPNPFNPTTSITFSVPQTSDVSLVVFDLLGQQVNTLFEGRMDRGTKVVTWDGRDYRGVQASSGMYIVRMTAGSYIESRKMVLMK